MFNAAAAISAAHGSSDLKEGVDLAQQALDSGAASERLRELVAFSNSGALT